MSQSDWWSSIWFWEAETDWWSSIWFWEALDRLIERIIVELLKHKILYCTELSITDKNSIAPDQQYRKGPDRLLRMMLTAPITINPEN